MSARRFGPATIAAVIALLCAGDAAGAQESDLAQVETLNSQASQLFRERRYQDAIASIREALAIREKVLGPDHLDVAASLNILGLLYDNQGRYHEAEPLYQRSLQIREKALGPDHPEIARSLNNL
jgi:tetratricopeptide (TPR) repeat protein